MSRVSLFEQLDEHVSAAAERGAAFTIERETYEDCLRIIAEVRANKDEINPSTPAAACDLITLKIRARMR